MNSTSMVRNAFALATAATIAGLSNPALAQAPAAPKSEVVWKPIGDAPGVVGMAVVKGRLFAATATNKLQVCDPDLSPLVWKEIGDCPGGVVAMGVADGKLFASTSTRSGTLHMREALDTAAPWQHIGHCWCCVGMTGTASAPGKIYGAISVNNGAAGVAESIMMRTTTASDVPWATNKIGHRPPPGILAFAEVAGKFYAATKEDLLFAGDVTHADVPWKAVGDAAGVTVLAGGDGRLFATTKSGKLLVWTPK
jgi:outer membrane protein assembly factor BamB